MVSSTDRKYKWKDASLALSKQAETKSLPAGLTGHRSGKWKKLGLSVCLWCLWTSDFMALLEVSQTLGCANVQSDLPPGWHFSCMYKLDSFSRRNWYSALSKTLPYLGNNFLDIPLQLLWPLGCCLKQWNQLHFLCQHLCFLQGALQVGKAQTEKEVVTWVLDGSAWSSTCRNINHTCAEWQKLRYWVITTVVTA